MIRAKDRIEVVRLSEKECHLKIDQRAKKAKYRINALLFSGVNHALSMDKLKKEQNETLRLDMCVPHCVHSKHCCCFG